MKGLIKIAPGLLIGILLVACSRYQSNHMDDGTARQTSARTQNTPASFGQQADWLRDPRVEAALLREARLFGTEQAGLEHIGAMRKLQQQADIVLEQVEGDRLRLVRSPDSNVLRTNSFRPSEIPDYVPTNHIINLAVIIVPYEVSSPEPNLETDRALRKLGVKRRVFQTLGPTHYYQLDSAEFETAPNEHK